jgi:hypothetical protein
MEIEVRNGVIYHGMSRVGYAVTHDDGFAYFWPPDRGGAYTSAHLRAVADLLDEMNAAWQETVDAYFDAPAGDAIGGPCPKCPDFSEGCSRRGCCMLEDAQP